MFLEKMSWAQICKRLNDNREFIGRNRKRAEQQWLKTAKKLRPLPTCYYKTVKNHDKDEFLIISYCHDGKSLRGLVLAVINSYNGKIYIPVEYEYKEVPGQERFCAHFFRRYKERRLKATDWPIEKVVTHYFMNNNKRLLVYTNKNDEKEMVYAVDQGLAITCMDVKNKFLNMLTYIDDEMLKVNQKIAKDYTLMIVPELKDKDSDGFYARRIRYIYPYMNEIYGTFKDDMSALDVLKDMI